MELDNWQTTLANCRDKMSYILNTGVLTDVIFIIGEEREFVRAHSLILRVNSPVFDVMLNGRWGNISTPIPLSPSASSSALASPVSIMSSASFSSSSQDVRRSSRCSNEGNLDECPRCKHQSYIPKRFRHHPYQGDRARERGVGVEAGDSNFSEINEIELPHLEPVSFRIFLEFIYTDVFNVPLEYALMVWHLAEFYNVPLLAEKCELFAMNVLGKENALMLYQHAQSVHHVRIAEMALQYIFFNAREIFASEDFFSLTIENLMRLLSEDRLDIEEANVFTRVYSWAEAECSRQELQSTPENIRLVLGEAFGLIRFPLIPAHRFTMDVVSKDLLSDAELIALYKYITLPSTERGVLQATDECKFSKVPRRHVYHLSRYNPQQTLCPKQRLYGEGGSRFGFTVDHDTSLVGVGLFASSPNAIESYDIAIDLKSRDYEVLSEVQKIVEPRKIKHGIVPILFACPVELRKGAYTIHYNVKGPKTYYNSGSCSKTLAVTSGTSKVTFTFSPTRCDAIDEEFGGIPIPEIYFVF